MIFGISRTKRTVRNREVSVRNSWTEQSNLSLRTPLYTDTSVKRTLVSVPLVSLLKTFDCGVNIASHNQLLFQ